MTTPDPTRTGHTTPSDFVHSATETDAKGGDAKACTKEMGEGQEGYKEGISIGPTRDGQRMSPRPTYPIFFPRATRAAKGM